MGVQGAGCQGNPLWIERKKLYPSPWFPEKRDGLEVKICHQWPMSSSIMPMEWNLPESPKEGCWESFQDREPESSTCHHARPWVPREQKPPFFLDLALCICSCGWWFVSFNSLCNKPMIQWLSRFSWALWPVLENSSNPRRESWELLVWSEAQVTDWLFK